MVKHEQIRVVLDDVISVEQCKELIHIHQGESVVGYRERFSVTMLQEIIRHGNFGYLIPMVRTREIVLNLVESLLKHPVHLMVEWTGISCWHTDSSIPPHYDSNRPYLKQRHYSVVVYMNDHDVDFKGGLFHFSKTERAEEEIIVPKAGRMVLFSSGPENMHFVDPITHGDRYTFTVWFTLDMECQEDPTIISFLNAHILLLQQSNNNINIEKNSNVIKNDKKDETNNNKEHISEDDNTTTKSNHAANEINRKSSKPSTEKEGGMHAEPWDIKQHKREKYGLTAQEGNYKCSGVTIASPSSSSSSERDVVDLCSFCYWKTGNLRISTMMNDQNPMTFTSLVASWHEYKKTLDLTFWDNVKLWQDTDLLYL